MLPDFFVIIYWWLILLALGFLAAPFVFRIFDKFWDKGWLLGKTASLIFITYLLFLLGRLHLLPFFRESIFLIILICLGLNFRFIKKEGFSSFKKEILKNRKTLFIEEGIFLLALVFWSFVRGFQPNIEGLEKFMDFGFVNSALRSKWFPPADMWFAGESINYYYFGHLQAAVLTKISGLDPAITYNLMVATVFALTFTSAFCLASNLFFLFDKKALKRTLFLVGLVSALLLSAGGNLHTIIYTLKDGTAKYWYPDATRFIGYRPNNPNDKTIHEFPAYSFVVADLHAHMNNIPTVLLFVGILLIFGFQLREKKKSKVFSIFALGFLLGIMYMTNSWDFPIYGILFALFAFLILLVREKAIGRAISSLFSLGIPVLLLAIIISLPFSLDFNPMAEGIKVVRAHSLWWQLLVLWGFFWFIAFGFWWFFLKIKKYLVVDIFVFSATLWATLLIIIPEFVYVKDIYIPEYHRANTMFKLVYQSFILYSLVSGYVFVRLRNTLREKKMAFALIYSLLFLTGFFSQMIFLRFALKGYYGSLTPNNYKGLYGMNFLKNQYPDDYEAVSWLRENIVGQPVVLEAVGDSYTVYNRVSAMTGLPTIEGWLVHEWLWRGGYDQPGSRAAEVETIFQGEDEQRAKQLLKKYQVNYVFVGSLEKEKYPSLKEEIWQSWGEEVFASGETKIYKLKNL